MSFRKLLIRQKLILLVLVACTFALALACAGFAVYERSSIRTATATNLATLADTLASNMAASIAFNDQKSAAEMLSALRTDRHILAAALYDHSNRFFAEYKREDQP